LLQRQRPLAGLPLGQLLIGCAALFIFPRPGNLSPRQFARDFFFVSRNLFRIGVVIGLAQREVIFGKRNEFVCMPKVAVVKAG